MNKFNKYNLINSSGRVPIRANLRDSLGWEIGDMIELIPNYDEKSLFVKFASDNSKICTVIESSGRVQIPEEMLRLLGWGAKDQLEHIVNGFTMIKSINTDKG